MPHFPIWVFLLLLQDLKDRRGCFAAPEVRKCHIAPARWAKPIYLLPGKKRERGQCKSGQRARWCQQRLCSGWGVSTKEEQGVGEQGWLHRPAAAVQESCWQRLPSELKLLNGHVLALPSFQLVSLAFETGPVAGSCVRAPDPPLLF